MDRPTICLSMIVKNEEKDIKRCLESVIPFIDYWVISDTGSTDNTKKIIQELMDKHGVPGELHDHEWVDFSTNRNYSLELARPHADFIWFMDADDNFVPLGSDPFSYLSKEYKLIHMTYVFTESNTSFTRACILNSKEDMRFHGVLHEVVANADGSTVPAEDRVLINEFGHIVARASPLKRHSTERQKYLADARILEEALDKNPGDTRSMFYLGQSYQLAGSFTDAMKAYALRAQFPGQGFLDEVFLSKYEIAKMKIALKFPSEECVDACISAWEEDPSRLEPLTLAMNYLYQRGRYGYALALGMVGVGTVSPSSQAAKFEFDVYDYKFPDIFALCRFRCGDREEAISSLEKLINLYGDSEHKAKAVEVLSGTVNQLKEELKAYE